MKQNMVDVQALKQDIGYRPSKLNQALWVSGGPMQRLFNLKEFQRLF